MKTPREKYMNDPTYSRLVDTICAFIHKAQFTPSEVREAAILACIIYEERRLPTTQIKISKEVEQSLAILHNWTDTNHQKRD